MQCNNDVFYRAILRYIVQPTIRQEYKLKCKMYQKENCTVPIQPMPPFLAV